MISRGHVDAESGQIKLDKLNQDVRNYFDQIIRQLCRAKELAAKLFLNSAKELFALRSSLFKYPLPDPESLHHISLTLKNKGERKDFKQ